MFSTIYVMCFSFENVHKKAELFRTHRDLGKAIQPCKRPWEPKLARDRICYSPNMLKTNSCVCEVCDFFFFEKKKTLKFP